MLNVFEEEEEEEGGRCLNVSKPPVIGEE